MSVSDPFSGPESLAKFSQIKRKSGLLLICIIQNFSLTRTMKPYPLPYAIMQKVVELELSETCEPSNFFFCRF